MYTNMDVRAKTRTQNDAETATEIDDEIDNEIANEISDEISDEIHNEIPMTNFLLIFTMNLSGFDHCQGSQSSDFWLEIGLQIWSNSDVNLMARALKKLYFLA